MAGPLRKFFLKLQPAIKLGGGGKALTARLLREELFFNAFPFILDEKKVFKSFSVVVLPEMLV